MDNDKVLKTCPRCRRRTAALISHQFAKVIPVYTVECPKCNTRTKTYLVASHAVSGWNTRKLAYDARTQESKGGKS